MGLSHVLLTLTLVKTFNLKDMINRDNDTVRVKLFGSILGPNHDVIDFIDEQLTSE